MNKLKVFVGADGKWVLCEKFPNDEDHAGLDDMLTNLVDEFIEVEEPMGFYMMSFELDIMDSYEYGNDSELIIKDLEKINENAN